MSDQAPELRALPGLNMAWAFIGLIAAALLVFVGVGFALPGTWAVERSQVISAPTDLVFPLLVDLEGWEQWTHWPELQGRTDGRSSGVGASRSWDDPNYGRGELTVTAVLTDQAVSYEVLIDGGGIQISGTMSITSVPGGSRVTWREEGDFGWNPLLAYMALRMDRMQGGELEKSLARLNRVVTGAAPDAAPVSDGGEPEDLANPEISARPRTSLPRGPG